ncbi:MAG: hypothetical protein QXL86_03760, partial [Candidatus Aenigmatarchaeota archaeon]
FEEKSKEFKFKLYPMSSINKHKNFSKSKFFVISPNEEENEIKCINDLKNLEDELLKSLIISDTSCWCNYSYFVISFQFFWDHFHNPSFYNF